MAAKSKTAAVTDEAFHGFPPALFDFVDGLAAHQTREWFLENKAAYERDMRAPMAAFVESLALAFAAHDIPLTGTAKTSMFRINRDVQFAKDKSPYKTNVSAALSRDGTKTAKGVFYCHVGGVSREAMMAVGFYGPEPADLTAFRQAIVGDPARWRRVEEALAEAGLSLSREGALARMPKGFEGHASDPVATALKLRNLVVVKQLEVKRVFAPTLIDDALAFVSGALPLLEFGWGALRT